MPPEKVVYVGDRADVDAAGADAAGLMGIWLNHAGELAPARGPAVPRIDSLEELASLLA
ncbi:HAD hydrolase-like protein [Streptomyces beijiangensis]|uniref:HAD hydrolase-like protein n=1 Tax=Streptomyces beijiangensis TaxID=163361 RepID=A0A939F7F6_9ACTN|nr:HAD hydrolase-like protein [Streptomyces beijiangensis]